MPWSSSKSLRWTPRSFQTRVSEGRAGARGCSARAAGVAQGRELPGPHAALGKTSGERKLSLVPPCVFL
jgi:hypothetical protein